MQVLERTGEDRDKRAASDAGSDAHAHPDSTSSAMADEALAVHASHITAAAVAAAAVTAAVVTGNAAASAPSAAAMPPPAAPAAPEPTRPAQRDGAPVPVASTRGALLVSALTLAVIGLALWLSAQWPQRALKPLLQHLPALSQPAPVPTTPARTPPAAPATPAEASLAPGADAIAQLQQEADEKARQLARKRAASEARQRRDDEALALREQRRREAEAQLAAARAKAERAQAAVLANPEIVQVPAEPALAEQLRQCRALSLFARERCLWKLCDGKWGKEGCPSYEHTNEGA